MSISNFDLRMFEQARKEAEKSTFSRFHIGCVIVYKNKIISKGCNSNKTHPLQQKYNKRYRKFNNSDGKPIKHSVHAEIDAITSIPYVVGKDVDFSKVKIFTYRISKGRKRGYACAKPCDACMNLIRDVGIRDVYYTDNDGLAYLRLE